jgi:hypothetical protein
MAEVQVLQEQKPAVPIGFTLASMPAKVPQYNMQHISSH